MNPFVQPARIRIVDKMFIKYWIQNPKNSVVQNSVAHISFVDMSQFGVFNVKCSIIRVLVSFSF